MLVKPEPFINEYNSLRTVRCDHLTQDVHSKSIGSSVECYDVRTVLPRPPNMDIPALGVRLSDLVNHHSQHEMLLPVLVRKTPAEAFQIDCLDPTIEQEGGLVWNGTRWIGSFEVLRE
ncbi:hypothetical protein NPIL_457531 [Nephila pilipes]|uniref:Uncharacterized protein n=1 Tax=Nephila pilipes TaxID=299642 RepID=A0A8X6T5L1_NEPPI|nr:hypothetical protein NPIL_457531 [Nephila pilipes]